jgi:pre-mRNA-splicing helicase BRR2
LTCALRMDFVMVRANTDVGVDDGAPRKLARGEGDEDANGDGGADELPVSAIDAYWLQRECGRYFGDPLVAQKVAADVLETLTEAEERDCENRLVILLDYDKFELIRLLLKHRYKIACCTRLAQAQSDAERSALLAEFEANDHTAAVVTQLQAARLKTDEIFTETKQLEARVRKETAELARMQASAEGAGTIAADMLAAVPEQARARVGQTLLDLEAMAFEQGGHLMSNKKCALPPGSFRTQRKGYEEVHIPALKPRVFGDDEALVEIASLP